MELDITYVIVWDLDMTMGDFQPFYDAPESDSPVTVSLRPGIIAALKRLQGEGFIHVLLTLATPFAAEVILHAMGVRDLFSAVYGRGQRPKGDAVGIGELYNIGQRQRPHRMIFIGDHPLYDPPQDDRIVFHLEPYALQRPANHFVELLLYLRRQGRGSIGGGFDRALTGRTGLWARPTTDVVAPTGEPVRREVPGLGPVLMLKGPDSCPVIAFEEPPDEEFVSDECVFVPKHFDNITI